MMLANVVPPLVRTCHWTAGAGLPLALAVNVTKVPAQLVELAGSPVMLGGVFPVTGLLLLEVQTALDVTVTFKISETPVPAVNVMLEVFVLVVIVPPVIVQ